MYVYKRERDARQISSYVETRKYSKYAKVERYLSRPENRGELFLYLPFRAVLVANKMSQKRILHFVIRCTTSR